MSLLELTHIDRDDVALSAVDLLGQGQGRFGLAHARGACEHQYRNGAVRVSKIGARGGDAPRDQIKAVVLANYALLHGGGQIEYSRYFVLDHAPHRNTGPLSDHRRDRLGVDLRENQWGIALECCELSTQVGKARLVLSAVVGPQGRTLL